MTKQMDDLFVSVIIPAYNGEAYLSEAVESIQRQNYHPLEIIIVDDGSTDGTARIATSFKGAVRYIYQPNSGGPAAGRNRGLKMARGEVVAFLDQDDLWPANKLALQIPRLVEDPSLEVVSGRVQAIQLSQSADGKLEFVGFLGPRIQMLLSCAIFRKSVFDKLGFFDEALQYCSDDLDWFMRAREHGISMVILDEVTLFWRMHEQNTSRDRSIRDHALTEVLKRSLDRRRQRDGRSVAPVPKFSDFAESVIKDHRHAG
jgi:glycosyltransferase involved in cell wall biosynthesis